MAAPEVARLLAGGDRMSFRVNGTCMYPAVRPGDVLHIRACTVAEVAVGDVAVCRWAKALFCHRVVEKGRDGGRAYIVTRPDRSRGDDDGPTYDEDLVGVVECITRRGATVALEPAAPPRSSFSLLGCRLALLDARYVTRAKAVGSAARAQELQLYKRAARWCFARAHPRLTYSVRVPLNVSLGDSVYRSLPLRGFDPEAPWNGRVRTRWQVVMSVNDSRAPASSLTLVRERPGEHRATAIFVRRRYGGLGLEQLLRERAALVLERAGARLLPQPAPVGSRAGAYPKARAWAQPPDTGASADPRRDHPAIAAR